MLRRLLTYTIVLSAGFLLNSCKRQNMCDCFKTRGETVTEERIVSDFTNLHVYDKINVYYTQDTTVSSPIVKIVTGKNLVKNIITEVKEGELSIKNGNKCNFVRGSHNDIAVYVTSRNAWRFLQEGVGSISCTNAVKADTVHAYLLNSGDIHLQVNTKYTFGHMHGDGDLYVEGTTQNFSTHTIGQGFIHAPDLQSQYTYLYYGSSGQAYVGAIGELDVVIAKSGDVYYYGNPGTLKCSSIGSGKLIHE
jgi:hypothetical protein